MLFFQEFQRDWEITLNFHGHFLSLQLLDLGNFSCRLSTKGSTSPVSLDLFTPLIVVGLDAFNKLVQAGAIIGLNLEIDSVT